MPKMTILDRLVKQGRIKPHPNETMWSRASFSDPLNYTVTQRQYINSNPTMFKRLDITPERHIYQQGLESARRAKIKPIREEEIAERKGLEKLQSDFEDAYSDAYESWQDEINSNVSDQAPLLEYGFEAADLDFDTPRADLRDFWPTYQETPEWFEGEADTYIGRLQELDDQLEHMRSPEYIQELQTMTPRYRNYQRAMQQRAANKRMGHQLGRMWGDAYNRLRARGLSDAEAHMYLHSYFGGR